MSKVQEKKQRKPSLKWTKEECMDIAINCKSRKEFCSISESAYRCSIRKKWMDEICAHMVFGNTKYTYDFVKREALKCKSVKGFRENYKASLKSS